MPACSVARNRKAQAPAGSCLRMVMLLPAHALAGWLAVDAPTGRIASKRIQVRAASKLAFALLGMVPGR